MAATVAAAPSRQRKLSARIHYKNSKRLQSQTVWSPLSSIVVMRAIPRQERVSSIETAASHHVPWNTNRPNGEYHAQLLGHDDHCDAGQRQSGQFSVLCFNEVVEKYRRCTAVPIWIVGQGSLARWLGSRRSLGAPRPSVGLPLAVAEP